ncbi:hypothetical protein AV530_000252 [Patagioenas fasciata monilis]|uniref:Uncharacterized protein n=1 Tax=Patagioenas fasciata monilis TaxID=372326 RepID=A0A1V4L0A5_PATFA|nr:hypothetical protein AV530_000252 [Patagioenas fasciata monilis]
MGFPARVLTSSIPTTKMESGKSTQSTKPAESQNKQPAEERQKEPTAILLGNRGTREDDESPWPPKYVTDDMAWTLKLSS